MSICGLSLHQGTTDSRKNLEQRFIFKPAPSIPTASTTFFIQLIFSCFSRNLVSSNSIAPCSVYIPYTTHNLSTRSEEGLTLETSAFQSLYGGQFTLSTQLINQNFCDDSSLLETQFKLVARAAVSVLSDKDPWLKDYLLTRLQQILEGPGGTILSVVGTFRATLTYKERWIYETVVVLKGQLYSLLNKKACVDLGLIS